MLPHLQARADGDVNTGMHILTSMFIDICMHEDHIH